MLMRYGFNFFLSFIIWGLLCKNRVLGFEGGCPLGGVLAKRGVLLLSPLLRWRALNYKKLLVKLYRLNYALTHFKYVS